MVLSEEKNLVPNEGSRCDLQILAVKSEDPSEEKNTAARNFIFLSQCSGQNWTHFSEQSPKNFVVGPDKSMVNPVEVVQGITHYNVAEHGEALMRRSTVEQQHAYDVSHALCVADIRPKLTKSNKDLSQTF